MSEGRLAAMIREVLEVERPDWRRLIVLLKRQAKAIRREREQQQERVSFWGVLSELTARERHRWLRELP